MDDFPCRCCCQAVKDKSFCSLFFLTLGTACWLLLNTATEKEAVLQHRAKPVSFFLSLTLCKHMHYINAHNVYSPIYTHLVFSSHIFSQSSCEQCERGSVRSLKYLCVLEASSSSQCIPHSHPGPQRYQY